MRGEGKGRKLFCSIQASFWAWVSSPRMVRKPVVDKKKAESTAGLTYFQSTHCFTFPFTEKNLKKHQAKSGIFQPAATEPLHLIRLTRSASPRRPDSWKRGAWYIAAETRAPFTVVVLPCTPSIKTATRPIMCTPVLISCPAAAAFRAITTSEDSNPRGNGFHLPP